MRIEELDDTDLSAKGGYVLLLSLKERNEIRTGKLGTIRFESGWYAYVGSAMGGFKQRISRHLRQEKKHHWHIDYLLEKALVEQVIICRSVESNECKIAGEISKVYRVINGFGSSDCKCPGHLFYSPLRVYHRIMEKLISIGMKPQLIFCVQDGGS